MARLSDIRAQWIATHVLLHEPALRAFLSARRVVHLEVDDIIQETYAILVGLESVDHIHNAKRYMFQTAKSVMLQHLRRARIVPIESVAELERLGLAIDEPSPEHQAGDRQELRRVIALITRLPDKCRQVFILRKMDGLSQREVSERLGVSESTVEKHVARGLRTLMETLRTGGNGGSGASSYSEASSQPQGERRKIHVRSGDQRRH